MRMGYTTGSCAALAAQAAAKALLMGGAVARASLRTPKGIVLDVPVENLTFGENWEIGRAHV